MSAGLEVSGFEVLDQYAPAEATECSVLDASHLKLLRTFSTLRAAMLVFFDNQSGFNFHQLTNSDLSAEYGIFWKCIPNRKSMQKLSLLLAV